MSTLYEAEVVIKATDEASSKLSEVSEKAKDTAENLDEAGDKAEESGKKSKESSSSWSILGNVAANIVTAGIQKATAAATQFAKQIVQTGMKFETSMSNVKALSGATEEEFQMLTETAREAGSTTVFSASEAADALGYMALAGWDAKESASALNGVLDLAAAGAMDLAEASDLVTDYMSAFGWEADRASEFADRLAFAQANSNTNVTQLGDAFQNCAANMNAAGQTMETTTALIEAMSNQGTKGARAGTALAAIMRDITSKMDEGAISINGVSVAVQDSEGNYRSLIDILSDVDAATQGLGTAEKSAALSAIFTSDSIKGVNTVLNEGVDTVKGYEDELYNCNGAASEMADTMNDNLAGSMKELESVTESLQITLYEKFEPALQMCVETATSVISRLDSMVESLSQIPDAVNAWASGSEEAMEQVTAATTATTEEMIWGCQYLSAEQAQAVQEYIANAQTMADTASATSDSVNGDLNDMASTSDSVSDSMSADADATATAYEDLATDISEAADDLVVSISSMWNQVNEDSDAGLADLIASMQEETQSMSQWADNMEILAERGIDEGLLQQLQEAGPESASLVQEIVDSSDEEMHELEDAFYENTLAATKAASVQVVSGCADIVEAVEGYRSGMSDAGEYMTEGLSDGINAGKSGVFSTVASLASQTVSKIKSALQIRSPSRVFRDEVGYMVGAGFAVGIDESTSLVEESAEDMAKAAQESASSSLKSSLDYELGVDAVSSVSGTGYDSSVISGNQQSGDGSTIMRRVEELVNLIGEYLPQLANLQMVVYPDKLAGAIAPQINSKLGRIGALEARTK